MSGWGDDVPDRQDLVEGTARVVAIEGGMAVLEPEQTTSCGGCASANMCGDKAGNSAQWLKARRFSVANDHDLAVGDRVVVGVANGSLLRSAAAAYGLPMLTMMAAGITAQQWGGGDGASALAAVTGLLVGLVLARLWSRRLLARGELSPTVLRRAFGPGSGGACDIK
jgi:sigma-E factor negative regulatory protein RseC